MHKFAGIYVHLGEENKQQNIFLALLQISTFAILKVDQHMILLPFENTQE
jgi:hypothetical protein